MGTEKKKSAENVESAAVAFVNLRHALSWRRPRQSWGRGKDGDGEISL